MRVNAHAIARDDPAWRMEEGRLVVLTRCYPLPSTRLPGTLSHASLQGRSTHIAVDLLRFSVRNQWGRANQRYRQKRRRACNIRVDN